MPDKFQILLKDLGIGKEKAISTVKKNVEIIVSHYFAKKYIEIDWIAVNNEICCPKVLLEKVFKDIIIKIGNTNSINNFSEYKDYIILKANERISAFFQNYFVLLFNNNKRAWPLFDTILKKRINSWLIKKGFTDNGLYEQLYQDAQIVFLKKLHKKELSFEDSRMLKSYIFKIINFKLLETQRTNKNQHFINIIEIELTHSDNYEQNIPEPDKEEFVTNLFKDLNESEKRILFEVYFMGEKLKDIAKQLDITEANCRVIKHRALAKLEKPARLLGYN